MIKNLSKLNTPHQGIPFGVVTNSHGGKKEMEIFEFPEVNINIEKGIDALIILFDLLIESGEWCNWNEWSQCTATCTGLNSMQVRQRSCQCPGPQAGGSECDGETFRIYNAFLLYLNPPFHFGLFLTRGA